MENGEQGWELKNIHTPVSLDVDYFFLISLPAETLIIPFTSYAR